ncbi:ABC transporter ATP-binding protein [Spirulina sp. CS-785/01]|uniref:ABC transporter ATP-binding protein n=1 Tax=Spirulina sp. CS-785/01 TaxID=3021716 RepID=UPI00232F8694|nr:ABC transporter ATP-binding protein [Spirulina sp. CS-785/01]MDB9312290.1 ABC transporter ATP-binding protein [Spirulina sp. CS-785/01]
MLLAAEAITGGYNTQPIVEAVNLNIDRGEWLSLVGANGSGKSTLLRLLTRLLKPQNGVVCLSAKDIQTLSPTAVAQQLALLPQQQTLPSGLTVYQLVSLGRSPYQQWWQWELDREGEQWVDWALQWTEMREYRDRPVAALSGGERQRAFLALALARNPQVLLLDEPTTFLDLHYQLQLLDLLTRLNQERGLAIVTVLHDINLAARYSDRLALLRQGQLWAVGPLATVLTPDNLKAVFDVEVAIVETPVGKQIYPLSPIRP